MKSLKIHKLWLGLVLTNLCLFALIGFAIVQDRARTIEDAEKVAENYSHTLEQNLLGFVRGIDIALLATVDEVQRQNRSAKLDAGRITEFMERQHARVPGIVGLRITDAQGTVRHAAGGVVQPNAVIGDMPHFQRAREGKARSTDAAPLFSEPLLGRVSHQRVINILRRYDNADGTFGGVVAVGITIEHLSEILRTVELGPYSVDSVWTRTQLVARNVRQAQARAGGELVKPVPQLQALIDAGAKKTLYHTAGTVDGMTRLVSARQVGDYPLYLAVGLADHDFLARWQEDAFRLALLAALFTLGSSALTWLIVRSERRRERLNRRLENERGFLKTLINTIPELVWFKAIDGRYLACNPAFEKFFGRTEAEILGKTDFDFVNAELARTFRVADLAAIEAGGVSYNEEWITYASDAHRALLRTGKTPMRDASGRLLGVLGVSHDITAQHRTEEALAQHQRNLQQLVDQRTQELKGLNQKLMRTQFAMESVGIGIHWVEAETGRFLAVNRKAAEMIGYEVEEMLRLKVMDVDPNFPQAEYEHIKDVIRSQGHINIETTQRARDGREVPLEVSIYYQEGGDTMPPLFIAFQTDITQRKAAEQAMVQARQLAEGANLAKSAFLANMSHEIRTPLNAITGMTHLIRRSGVTPEQSDRLAKIEMAGRHLLEIINAILDLSKIEAGKFTLEAVPVDVGAIVGNVASILGHQAQAKQLQIVIDNQLVNNSFIGDPTRLQQGLLNFGSNAIKFSTHGRVTLRVQALESDADCALLRFEVEDQGIGIDDATLARLFSAFEQADTSTTREYGGTGLGLAITKKLAELMGGDAGASSEVGRGSRFWFTARLRVGAYHAVSQPPAPSLPSEAILARDHAGARLLLVEDDDFNQEIALILLREIWPVVDLAADGLEAVERAQATRYDLILMDMQMPRLDGLDATRRIRALPGGADVPIIAMTANAFVEDRNRCFAAGMNDFLSKPVNPADLYDVILKWIRR